MRDQLAEAAVLLEANGCMSEQVNRDRGEAISGCILGTAIGDSVGLPYEGIPRRRLQRMLPHLDRHNFVFGRGMVSDDTEHTLMVSQALISSAGDVDEFTRVLAKRLKIWLVGLPAGVGFATARATFKLIMGFSPEKSGVFSAGNGPAMRSAIIGVCFGHDPDKMKSLVRASTRITHTDPKAELGALAIAVAAYHFTLTKTEDNLAARYLNQLSTLFPDIPESRELLDLISQAADSANRGNTTLSFADEMGWKKGISGYIYATVPVVLHSCFRNQNDYASAITDIIMCGGDTDTAAAIAGAIIGAGVGTAGIPQQWTQGLMEWPCSVKWMDRLAAQLCLAMNDRKPKRALTPALPLVFLRNLFFLIIVLCHGFRRLLPPY